MRERASERRTHRKRCGGVRADTQRERAMKWSGRDIYIHRPRERERERERETASGRYRERESERDRQKERWENNVRARASCIKLHESCFNATSHSLLFILYHITTGLL